MLDHKFSTSQAKPYLLEAFACRALAAAAVGVPAAVWLLFPQQAAMLEQFGPSAQIPLAIRVVGLAGSLPAGIGIAVGMEHLARFLLSRGPLGFPTVSGLNRSARWLLAGSLWLALGKWSVSAVFFLAWQGQFPRPPYILILGAAMVLAFSGVLRRTASLLADSIRMKEELEQIV